MLNQLNPFTLCNFSTKNNKKKSCNTNSNTNNESDKESYQINNNINTSQQEIHTHAQIHYIDIVNVDQSTEINYDDFKFLDDDVRTLNAIKNFKKLLNVKLKKKFKQRKDLAFSFNSKEDNNSYNETRFDLIDLKKHTI